MPDRWVRFYSLPGAKRYPDSSEEYDELLRRADTLLATVCDRGDELMVVTGLYREAGSEPERTPAQLAAQPVASYWREIADPYYDPNDRTSLHLWVSWEIYDTGALNAVIRRTADDDLFAVLIVAASNGTALHPYDGGVDVILPSPPERDDLRQRFSAWASPRPDGL